MPALITATGVKKSFGKGSQKVTVLKGIDLTILPGESVAIVGKEGVRCFVCEALIQKEFH